MQIELTCQYCNFKDIKDVYNPESLKNECCRKCGDRNVELRDLSATKIDAYKGCPPFPPKEVKKDIDKYEDRSNWPW